MLRFSQRLEIRVKAHNVGKVRSTKAFRPWELYYYETFESKTEARRRELFFKSIEGYVSIPGWDNHFVKP